MTNQWHKACPEPAEGSNDTGRSAIPINRDRWAVCKAFGFAGKEDA
jgi:hypothetical protein